MLGEKLQQIKTLKNQLSITDHKFFRGYTLSTDETQADIDALETQRAQWRDEVRQLQAEVKAIYEEMGAEPTTDEPEQDEPEQPEQGAE